MIGTVKQSKESLQLCIYFIGLCIYSGGETGHNEILTVKSDLEGKGQSTPSDNRGLNQAVLHIWSKFGGPSAWTGDELWCGQAHNGVALDIKS